MFLTFICLGICLTLGYIICSFFLKGNIAVGDLFIISIVLGLVLMSYSVLLLALLFGDMGTAVSIFMGVGGIVSVFYLRPMLPKLKRLGNTRIPFLKRASWIDVIFVALMLLTFLDLFSKTLAYGDNSFWVASEGFGDIPFHMNQVSYFIYNNPFGLESSIYSATSLTYHFLINFLSAAFFFLNKNYALSFQLPPVILGSTSIILLYSVISKVIKRRAARISAFLIFFFGTSMGFLKILADENILAKKGLGELLKYLLHLPYPLGLYFSSIYPEQNILWSTFLTMCFMHQRAFIFGLAVALACLLILYSLSQKASKKTFYFLGAIVGLLPLVQIHSFIAVLTIVSSFFLVAFLLKKRVLLLGFLRSIILSIIVSLPSFVFLFSSEKENSIRFRWGWMMDSFAGVNINPQSTNHFPEWLYFIWQNSGLLIPTLAIAIIYLFFVRKIQKQKDIFQLSLVLSVLALWAALNTVQFQKWDFDGYKIYGYFLLFSALVIGIFFDQLKLWLKMVPVIIITILLTISGFIIVLSHSSIAAPSLYPVFNKNDAIIATWIIKNTSSQDIILTAPTNVNLVSSLAGRPVLLGDFMWVWPHGLNWQVRYDDMEKMYQGDAKTSDLFKKYKIAYVLIGDRERKDLRADEGFFETNYPLVFQFNSTRIYKVLGK